MILEKISMKLTSSTAPKALSSVNFVKTLALKEKTYKFMKLIVKNEFFIANSAKNHII